MDIKKPRRLRLFAGIAINAAGLGVVLEYMTHLS